MKLYEKHLKVYGDVNSLYSAAIPDRYFSQNTVWKVMRKVLPKRTRITMGAQEAVRTCATEFISFLTCE